VGQKHFPKRVLLLEMLGQGWGGNYLTFIERYTNIIIGRVYYMSIMMEAILVLVLFVTYFRLRKWKNTTVCPICRYEGVITRRDHGPGIHTVMESMRCLNEETCGVTGHREVRLNYGTYSVTTYGLWCESRWGRPLAKKLGNLIIVPTSAFVKG